MSENPREPPGRAPAARAPRRDERGVFDADTVWVLFEGKLERLAKVWEITKATLPSQVRDLSEALARQDSRSAARLAHALAGSGSTFGAREMVKVARAIEHESRRGNVSGEMAKEISDATALFLDAFAQWLDQITSAASLPDTRHDG